MENNERIKYVAPICHEKHVIKLGLNKYVLEFDKNGLLIKFGANEVSPNVNNRFNLKNISKWLEKK